MHETKRKTSVSPFDDDYEATSKVEENLNEAVKNSLEILDKWESEEFEKIEKAFDEVDHQLIEQDELHVEVERLANKCVKEIEEMAFGMGESEESREELVEYIQDKFDMDMFVSQATGDDVKKLESNKNIIEQRIRSHSDITECLLRSCTTMAECLAILNKNKILDENNNNALGVDGAIWSMQDLINGVKAPITI